MAFTKQLQQQNALLPSRQQIYSLIHGYIRNETKSTSITIPKCIRECFFKFYSEILYTPITSKLLETVMNAKHDESFDAGTIIVKGIEFECWLKPNRYNSSVINFCIQLKPTAMKAVTFRIIIHSPKNQLGANYVDIFTLPDTNNTPFAIMRYDDIEWQDPNIKQFILGIKIEILSLTNSNYEVSKFNENVKMKKISEI